MTPSPKGGPTWRQAIGPAIVLGLSCAVAWASMRVVHMPPAWFTFEFCQYAEIGRNLAVDGTYDTRLVEPMALAMLDRRPRGDGPIPRRWPVVNRYPLPAMVIAGLMKVFGTTDAVAAWSNGLAIGVLAATCFVAARRWSGEGWAWVVAVLFLANPSFYGEFLLLGSPDVWFAALFVLELLMWSRGGAEGGIGWASGVGALVGLCYLTRSNASLFIAVQFMALSIRRRWPEALAFGLAAAAVASPLFAYNGWRTGWPVDSLYSSWNLLDRIGAYRVEPWLYYRVPDVGAELAAHSDGFARKIATNLGRSIPRDLPHLWRLELILPLALAGIWASPRGTDRRRFAGWAVGLFLLQLVVFSGLRLEFEGRDSPHTGRYFFWFAGPAVVLGVGTLARLSAWRRAFLIPSALIVAAQLVSFGGSWTRIARYHATSTNLASFPIRKVLTEIIGEGRLIASNQPQLTAWFSGVRSISLPADPEELARLNRQSPTPADYLMIDTNYNCIDLDMNWVRLVQPARGKTSPWEPILLRDYEYVFPPERTRPIRYVLLRRRSVPPSRLELQVRGG